MENIKIAAYKIFKKPFFGRFSKPWRWPEGEGREQWRSVIFKSDSGTNISALIGTAHTRQVSGAVLLCHPMGVLAKGFWMKYGHAEVLRKAGYHVMVFDLNGFGESTSTTMDFPLDILAAGRVLQEEYPHLPIGVLGASMGAAMTVCAMSQPEHPFKAAVLESALPTLMHFWSRYPLPRMSVFIAKLIYPAGEKRLRPIYAAENIVGDPSILMIYGDADEFTPVKDGELLRLSFKNKNKVIFWVVPNAVHTPAYKSSPDEYERRVVEFFDRGLKEYSA